MRSAKIAAASMMVLALSACGGGGGAVNSMPTPAPAPAPAPTPTPTPPATNSSLAGLRVSQTFVTDAVTSEATLGAGDITVTASQGRTSLTVRYDAASASYTVSSPGGSETFAPSQITDRSGGVATFEKNSESTHQFFTLANTAYANVAAGYWQRNTTSSNLIDIEFDAFTYGFETAAAAMPRTGGGSYAVEMFGFLAPLNVEPKIVAGTGTFEADFLTGNFAATGTSRTVELTADYYSGLYDWRAGGRIASTGNAFSGHFALDAAHRITVAGDINGRLYGPSGQELGAAFNASDAAGTLLAGTLLGRKASDTIQPLTLSNVPGTASFYGTQASLLYLEKPGTGTLEGAAPDFPDQNGRLDVAQGSYRLVPKLSSNTYPSPTFTAADRVTAESDARYTVYRKQDGGDSFRLSLYNPGSGNDELALTYASFGRWERSGPWQNYTQFADIWFAYGVPTQTNTLARTGSAHYDAFIRGSGVTFADAAHYSMTGSMAMDVDFATLKYIGTLSAAADRIGGGAGMTFGPLGFGGDMYNTYAFESFLSSRPGFADGSIRGRLYGPGGDEVGAAFQIEPRNAQGSVIGMFDGVAIGKKK